MPACRVRGRRSRSSRNLALSAAKCDMKKLLPERFLCRYRQQDCRRVASDSQSVFNGWGHSTKRRRHWHIGEPSKQGCRALQPKCRFYFHFFLSLVVKLLMDGPQNLLSPCTLSLPQLRESIQIVYFQLCCTLWSGSAPITLQLISGGARLARPAAATCGIML